MNHKPLYLFVGKSASGKSTITNILEEKYGLKTISSYTTRPPRYEGEREHVFLSESEFDELGELAAYTLYNGYRYGVTFEQIEECDTYVIDIPGIQYLLGKINSARPIFIIYFDASVSTRIDRMVDRGASDMEIIKRLHHDDTHIDWFDELYELTYHHDVDVYVVNADKNIEDVLEQVLCILNKNEMEW